MKRFIEGEDRAQITLFPDCLDDYIAEDNPVRAVEAFIDALDLGATRHECYPGHTRFVAGQYARPSNDTCWCAWYAELRRDPVARPCDGEHAAIKKADGS